MEKTWKEWLEEQRAKGMMSAKSVSFDSVGGGWGMQDGGKRYG